MRIASLIAALYVCLLTTWAQAPAPHQRPKTSANAKVTDAQLESAIKAKFAKSKSASKFTVRVQGGVATIDGATEIVQHKAAATRMAKTAGATGVVNRVQVSEAAKKKASGNLEQGRRRVQIKRGDSRDERK